MTAFINYGSPPIGVSYYKLPLFEAHPKQQWISQVAAIVFASCDKIMPKGYWLTFQSDKWGLNFDEGGEGLLEHQIRMINELYFDMLDNNYISGSCIL